jgi:general secretion pathway protein N
MRTIALVAIAVAVVLGVALWTFPADLAYRYVGNRLAPVALRGLGGTIWQGRAAGVDLIGHDLGRLDWTLQFLPLLRNEVVAQVALSGDSGNGHAVVERDADGRLQLHDAVVTVPARVAAPVLAIPALDLLGTIEIQIGHARLLGAWPADAAGTASWRNAAVAGAAQAQLGELRATFASTTDGGIAGTVVDLGGPLEVAGTFAARAGQYEAQARLAARGNNPQVTEALQYVGQPRADGSRDLEIRGRQLNLF